MASKLFAALLRPLLYQLEALEPRRFLSVDVSTSIESPIEWDLQTRISGKLASDVDVDFIRFEAAAGETIVFNSQGFNTYTVLDSDAHTELAQFYIHRSYHRDYQHNSGEKIDGILRWTAQHSGVHYLSVAFKGFCMCSPNGEYILSALRVPGDSSTDSAKPISAGQSVSGSIDAPGQVDYLRFDALANAFYSFSIVSDSGDAAVVLSAITPSADADFYGRNIHYNMDIGPLLIANADWTAPHSGTFFLSVSLLNASATGQYTIKMDETPDDHGNDVAHATRLDLDRPQKAERDYWLDSDSFYLPVQAGHTYLLTATGASPGYSGFSTIEGALFVTEEMPQSSRHSVIFTAQESKNLFFFFDGFGLIDAAEITPALPTSTTPAIASGESVLFSLDQAPSVRYFKFESEAATEYTFTISPEKPGAPAMYVVDAEGNVVNDRYLPGPTGGLRRQSQQARTLYVAIAALDADQVGQYTLTFQSGPPTRLPPLPVEDADEEGDDEDPMDETDDDADEEFPDDEFDPAWEEEWEESQENWQDQDSGVLEENEDWKEDEEDVWAAG